LRHSGIAARKLARVPLRVPLAGVRICPLADRLGIEVVEDPLHHAAVEEQAFDLVALPRAAGVSRLAVDVERLADDAHLRLPRLGSRGG
jgi:hypothetical protein